MNEIRPQIKQLRFFHSMMVLSLSTVLFLSYYLLSNESAIKVSGGITANNELLLILSVVVCVALSFFFYKNKQSKLKQIDSIVERMDKLRVILIVQYALIELAVIISIIVFYATGTRNFFLYAALLLVYLLYLRPHDMKIKSDLQLDDDGL